MLTSCYYEHSGEEGYRERGIGTRIDYMRDKRTEDVRHHGKLLTDFRISNFLFFLSLSKSDSVKSLMCRGFK